MEIHELLKLSSEEVDKLPLVSQLKYYQQKYQDVWVKINDLFEQANEQFPKTLENLEDGRTE